jgi:hypothetical protein
MNKRKICATLIFILKITFYSFLFFKISKDKDIYIYKKK